MTGETKLYNDKVVISGRHVERYKYDRLQLDGCQNLKSYTKREIPEDEKLRNKRQNLYRAAKEIRRRINANLTHKNDTMLTLTYADIVDDRTMSNRYFTLFVLRLKAYILKHHVKELKYIAVIEYQERGAIHYHMLMFDVPYIPAEVIAELWGHGFVKLKQVSKEGTPGYLTKYLCKEAKNVTADDLKNEHKKSYFCSRNLAKYLVIKLLSHEHLDRLLDGVDKITRYTTTWIGMYTGFTIYTAYILKETTKNTILTALTAGVI